MFVLCPHCHFLVGLDPRTGTPPSRCPKCGRALAGEEAVADNGPGSEASDPLATAAVPAQPAAAGAAQDAADAAPRGAPAMSSPDAAAPEPAAASHGDAPAQAKPQPDAEAMIAAMAAKPPRRQAARRKAEPAKPTAAPKEARARTSRAAHKPSDESAALPAPPQRATPQAPPTAAIRATWWARVRQALRIRRAPTQPSPPLDPLAASVRHRARRQREAAAPPEAGPVHPPVTTTVDAPVAGTHVQAAPATSTAPPSAVDAPAAAPHAATPPSSATPTAGMAVSRAASAPSAEPGVATASEAPTPLSPPPATTPDDRVDDTGPVPFVERRRNPDLPTPPGVVPTHPLRRRTDAPSFARPRPAALAPRTHWRWGAAVAALSLLLVLQLLLAQRDVLAGDARWRPVVAGMCAVLRCALPPWREPQAFTMLSRDVRAHPASAGALLVNASFRNDARWPQPWPRVLLTLSDVDGRIVGARAFAAPEYLGADGAATQRELAPGQTAAISLAVVEPAPDIVAFSFDFR